MYQNSSFVIKRKICLSAFTTSPQVIDNDKLANLNTKLQFNMAPTSLRQCGCSLAWQHISLCAAGL